MGRTRSLLLRRTTRARFLVEAALGVTSLVFLALTLFVSDWVEAIFGVDPDRHSGSLEWALDGVFLATAVAAGVLARIEWRRMAVDPVSVASHPH
jgi:hypothetical protein